MLFRSTLLHSTLLICFLLAWTQNATASQQISVEDPATLNQLAASLLLRARETADPAYLVQAEQAIDRSLQLKADDFASLRLQLSLLIGQQKYTQVIERAEQLRRMMPDEVAVYSALSTAYRELGRYTEAEQACQTILDLRLGQHLLGFMCAARLREIFGEIEGAIQFTSQALLRTPSDEIEQRAHLLSQLARLNLLSGQIETAEKNLLSALQLLPHYPHATGLMAQVRNTQGRFDEAVELLQKRYQASPQTQHLFELAQALERAGKKSLAKEAFTRFAQQAQAQIHQTHNANLQLINYYADYAKKPQLALHVAEISIAMKQDAHTRAAYAWALYINQRYRAAQEQSDSALSVGLKDAQLFYRAGLIALRNKNKLQARKHFTAAANLRSDWAQPAQLALRKI